MTDSDWRIHDSFLYQIHLEIVFPLDDFAVPFDEPCTPYRVFCRDFVLSIVHDDVLENGLDQNDVHNPMRRMVSISM